MEATKHQRKQRKQRRNHTEVQRQTNQAKDFASRRLDFYLSSLEEEIRCEFKDSTAILTRGQSEERLHLDIHVDSLTALLDELQDRQEENNDKEQMQTEISRLQALLECAQTKQDQSKKEDTETLKLHLRKISFMLRTAQRDLEQKTSYSKDLEAKLELIQKEKENLQQEIEAMKLEVHVEKQLRAVAENSMDNTHGLKKKAEDLLESERIHWQQERSSLLKENEQLKAFYAAQLDEQTQEKKTLVDALQKAEQQLESHQVMWQEEESALLQATEDLKKTIQEREQEANRTMEDAKNLHQAQLEEQRAETITISSALKKTEDLLETERCSWKQEKTSLQEELDIQKKENNNLADTLKKTEQQLESHRTEWQKEKSSLLQATEDIKRTLQEKEQEWEKEESALNSQLTLLETQLAKKKRKKKWYSIFLCGV